MSTPTIVLNEQRVQIESKTTVFSLLQALQVYPGRAVVIVNGVVIERADYQKVCVLPGDDLTLTIETTD